MEFFLQVLINGILLGMLLALVAVGLTLIFGVVDIVNFAHGEFVMVGMYTAFFVWALFGLDPILGVPIVAGVVGVLGWLSYRSVVKPALRGTLLSQIFSTFGLMIFLRGVAQSVFGADFRATSATLLSTVRLDLGPVAVPGPQLVAALGGLLGTTAIGWFVWRTRAGKALWATAQDREAAALMGINTDRMFALAWFIGGAATGVAAALVAVYQPVHPNAGVAFGLTAFIIVALGGFGSIGGALVAALLVGVVENIAGSYLDPAYKQLWIFALFLAVLFFRPQGLLGRR